MADLDLQTIVQSLQNITTKLGNVSQHASGSQYADAGAGAPIGGSITGVTAGTGLTGGGTSGVVTVALDTPVSVANGGTGASDASDALINLGAAPLDSPKFTGAPTAPEPPPGNDSQAIATTHFVVETLDSRQNRNRIINGDFLIDQRNNYASVTPGSGETYVCDRWLIGATTGGLVSTQVIPSAGTMPSTNLIGISSLGAYTPGASDYCVLHTLLEFSDVGDFDFGAAQASPVSLSFQAIANNTGLYSGALNNSDASRSFTFTFFLSANQLTQVTIPIPGDTAGTWSTAPNAKGLAVLFDLGSGANYRNIADAPALWVAANYVGAADAVSLVETSGATLQISNVQLERGSAWTPFDWRPFVDVLAQCQRYYQVGSYDLQWWSIAMMKDSTTAIIGPPSVTQAESMLFRVVMRVAPTIVDNNTVTLNCTGTLTSTADTMFVTAISTAYGQSAYEGAFTLDADF